LPDEDDIAQPAAEELQAAVSDLGFPVKRARVIADGAHHIVLLKPANVVARVATLFPGDEPAHRYSTLANELKVARCLAARGVGTILPAAPAGPHPLGSTWFTLWGFQARQPAAVPVTAAQLWEAITGFHAALDDLAEVPADQRPALPVLGPWREAAECVRRLDGTQWLAEPAIARMVRLYEYLDPRIASLELAPAHGDAHRGNLRVGDGGELLWLDFEDVSLMPRYWDAACVVARNRLLGLDPEHSPWFERAVRAELPAAAVHTEWELVLLARAVQATLVGRFFEAFGHEEDWVTQARITGTRTLLKEYDESCSLLS
jgi:hypothetical protein